MDIDTTNRFAVGLRGDDEIIVLRLGQRLTREDALNLAAYLVAVADSSRKDFDRLLAAVLAT